MSFSIDVNLLIYAANASVPEHKRAVAFLRDCAEGSEAFYLTWPTVMAFLRICTHHRVFPEPMTFGEATERVAALLCLSHVRMIGESGQFWETFMKASDEIQPRGNLVLDAHLAALLHDNGVRTLYTNDTDFRRFPFLRVINPLAGP